MAVKLSQIRAQFPMYDSVPDDQLLSALHRKFYADLPIGEFVKNIDYDTQRTALQKEVTDDTNTFQAGAGRSVAQLGRTLQRLNPFSDYDQKAAADDAEVDKPLMDTRGGFWGNLAGEVAMTAVPGLAGARVAGLAGRALPQATRVLNAGTPTIEAGLARMLPQAVQASRVGRAGAQLAAAAGTGAAQGAAFAPEDFGRGAEFGAAGGVIGQGLGAGVSKVAGGVARGITTDDARALMEQGIDVPLWKAVGPGVIRSTGEAMRRLPGVGSIMKRQEAKAMEDYTRSLARDATPPQPALDEASGVLRWVDNPVEEGGQRGMRDLHDRFKEAYSALHEGRSMPIDDALMQQMHGISDYARNYKPGLADDVDGTMREALDTLRKGTETTPGAVSQILDASGAPIRGADQLGHAGVPAENFQRAIKVVEDEITRAFNAGDGVKGNLLSNMADELRAARTRALPPEVQAAEAPVNAAYAKYKTLQRASSRIGSVRNEGVVTPSQQLAAIVARDKSAGKRLSSEGVAPGQQQAQQAHNVLGSELPEVGPGTAEASTLAMLLGGGMTFPTTTAIATGLASRQGQKALLGGYDWQELVRAHPDVAANLLKRLGITAGQGAASVPPNQP